MIQDNPFSTAREDYYLCGLAVVGATTVFLLSLLLTTIAAVMPTAITAPTIKVVVENGPVVVAGVCARTIL